MHYSAQVYREDHFCVPTEWPEQLAQLLVTVIEPHSAQRGLNRGRCAHINLLADEDEDEEEALVHMCCAWL